MENAETLVLGEAWTKSEQLLEEVNKEIAFVFDENKYSEWINYEVPCARIARKILENSFKLEELAINKQTFKFYHSEKLNTANLLLTSRAFSISVCIDKKVNDFKLSFGTLNRVSTERYGIKVPDSEFDQYFLNFIADA